MAVKNFCEQILKCFTSPSLFPCFPWPAFSCTPSMAATFEVTCDSSLPPKILYIKDLVESTNLTSIPSNYAHTSTTPDQPLLVSSSTEEEQIPIIDFSLLTSNSPAKRSKVIQELYQACTEWGFFMVINHGVEERLREDMLDACKKFFDMSKEEKVEYSGKQVLDPIRCGTSFNASVEKAFFWRDFLKVIVHPMFHSPSKPTLFRDISIEYSTRTREIARELLKGISESLGLDASYIDKAMELESGLQILAANFYPPCPQPELALGMPPHSDHGLLTLLIQNQVGGLQVKHDEKWVNVNAVPNSFLVNTGDHIEILSNGKFKSVVHRAVVNNKSTRISLAMAHGPALDKMVSPAPELVDIENQTPAYRGMRYRDYLEFQQSNQLDGKSCLDSLRV